MVMAAAPCADVISAKAAIRSPKPSSVGRLAFELIGQRTAAHYPQRPFAGFRNITIILDSSLILRFGVVWMFQYGGNLLFPDFRVLPLDLGFVGGDVGQHTPIPYRCRICRLPPAPLNRPAAAQDLAKALTIPRTAFLRR